MIERSWYQMFRLNGAHFCLHSLVSLANSLHTFFTSKKTLCRRPLRFLRHRAFLIVASLMRRVWLFCNLEEKFSSAIALSVDLIVKVTVAEWSFKVKDFMHVNLDRSLWRSELKSINSERVPCFNQVRLRSGTLTIRHNCCASQGFEALAWEIAFFALMPMINCDNEN